MSGAGGGFRGRGGGRGLGFRGRGSGGGGGGEGGSFRGRGGFRGRGDSRGGRGGGGPRGRGGFRGGRDGSRGRGMGRGGRGGRGGMRGGKKVVIEPHRHPGVFIAHGKDDALCTANLVVGDSVYGEKRVSIDKEDGVGSQEYRMWNPFRSKLAAAILSGVENIYMPPGSKVLYLGAASGTTVSHISDIIGPEGLIYAVEFSCRSGRDLLQVAQKRNNIVPILEDARHPLKYRMIISSLVDTIFADVAQPDQARIVAINAHHYLKPQGHFVLSIKANCIDSTAKPEHVFAGEVEKLKKEQLKPEEQVTLQPFEKDHAVVVGAYRVGG